MWYTRTVWYLRCLSSRMKRRLIDMMQSGTFICNTLYPYLSNAQQLSQPLTNSIITNKYERLILGDFVGLNQKRDTPFFRFFGRGFSLLKNATHSIQNRIKKPQTAIQKHVAKQTKRQYCNKLQCKRVIKTLTISYLGGAQSERKRSKKQQKL